MEDVFEKEVIFVSKEFIAGVDGQEDSWQDTLIKKIATFKELKRTAKSQHKLHFKIVALFSNIQETAGVDGQGQQKIVLDDEMVYDLTVKCVKELVVINDNFTAQNKEELLNDSGALYTLGIWLLGNKITPFFSEMRKTA